MKKYLFLLVLFLWPVVVSADNSFVLSCDKDKNIMVGESVICRVSVRAGVNFNKIDFDIVNTNGIEITDVRSNYEKLWQISKNDNHVTVTSNELQSGLQEFGIILVKALEDGTKELLLENIILTNIDSEEEYQIDPTTKSLKILSSDNTLKSITVNGKELDFNTYNYNYTVKIDNEEEVTIEAETNNEFATVKGIGTFKTPVSVNKFVYPLEVISEDGIAKIYVLILERDSNKNYKDLEIDFINIKNDKGNNLLINFNPSVYEYTFDVDVNTKYLEIKPDLKGENTSFVKNYGEQKIELKSGNNIALIKVQNEDGDILTYVLNITKPLVNKSNNNYIKSLVIDNYNLKFSKRIKNYTLEIDPNDAKLNIKVVLEDTKARYTISGNNDLKSGSVIKIEVTAENEEKATYKINIKEKSISYTNIAIISIGGLLVLYILFLLKDRLFKKNKKAAIKTEESIVVPKPNIIPAEDKIITKNKDEELKETKVVKKPNEPKKAEKKSTETEKPTAKKEVNAPKVKESKTIEKKPTEAKKSAGKKEVKASKVKDSKTTVTKSSSAKTKKVDNSKNKKVSSNSKKTTSKKPVTNSTSTRSPRSNYTKKSPAKKKKTTKKAPSKKTKKK